MLAVGGGLGSVRMAVWVVELGFCGWECAWVGSGGAGGGGGAFGFG